MRTLLRHATVIVPIVGLLAGKLAGQQDRITSPIDNSQRVTLTGDVSPEAQQQNDRGPVEPSFQMGAMTMLLKPSAGQQAALNQLLAEQQDPNSPNYHKWLTPDQYADRFGASQTDISKIVAWLQSQGFMVNNVARSRNAITFSGTAQQVKNAFQTQIDRYEVNGKLHYANATAPSIPAALASIVTGLRGLNDFRPKPLPKTSTGRLH